MINKKYSIQEAFEKGLLLSGDYVNLEGLYVPERKIVLGLTSFGGIQELSLKSYFDEKELQRVKIRKEPDNSITAICYRKYSSIDTEIPLLVASKLLTNDLYGIMASHKLLENKWEGNKREFTITIDPNIIVRFEGEDETAFLELPPHTAYTC